jgi:hypothetical protein
MSRLSEVAIGYQVYLAEGGEEFGAVRAIGRDDFVVYVENGGDFTVEATAIKRVHDGKVVLDGARLGSALRTAIAHAHDREEPGL